MPDFSMPNATLPPPPENLGNEPPEQQGSLFSQRVVKDIIIGVVVVLFIGFVGALIATGAVIENYLASQQATYEDLKDKVLLQNGKMDTLSHEICQLEKQRGIACAQ